MFGGHFLGAPGRYDRYAIRYGYSRLEGEVRGTRHAGLEVLANGQDIGEELAPEPRNPLFASDEDVGGLDPRVQPLGGCLRILANSRSKHSRQNAEYEIVIEYVMKCHESSLTSSLYKLFLRFRCFCCKNDHV